ncbi:MAG: lipase family protein [Burkholderiales bacterium]|nr:lipase family protein [Burkholderiales bacterium]
MRDIAYYPDRESLLSPQIEPHQFDALSIPITQLHHDQICSELSRLVYKHFEVENNIKNELKEFLEIKGFTNIDFFSNNSTQAIAGKIAESNTLIICFRGTQSDCPSDVIADVDIRKVDWIKGGKVHNGFVQAFETISGNIGAWLYQNNTIDDSKIVFTGHSLGAALATLAAHYFRPQVTTHLVTFGSPLVGDDDFINSMPDTVEIARYVNCCDIVTRIPPEIINFKHMGSLKYIDMNGIIRDNFSDLQIESDQSAARKEYWDKYTWKHKTNAFRDLSDHAPINYVAALFKIKPYSV